jgi:hypothetical protein
MRAARAAGARAVPAAHAGEAPAAFALHAPQPNPFASRTTLAFDLPETTHVRLVVYDVLGREVARLVDGTQEAGVHSAAFDARGLAAGTYVYRLTVGRDVEVGRMTLAR